jgi:hypothetical protein
MVAPRRILVTGSRDWADYKAVARELVRYISENSVLRNDSFGYPVDWDTQGWVIVHGACPTGADHWADEYAISNWIEVERHPADWALHGPAAGPRRNTEMVDEGADVCIAFVKECVRPFCKRPKPHWSHGTSDCIRKAEAAGIEVRRIYA